MKIKEILSEIKAYHGSSNNHQEFDTKHTGQNSHTFGHYSSSRSGIFFTTNPEFAKIYGDVQEYDLNISKTYNLDKNFKIIDEFMDYIRDKDRSMFLFIRDNILNNGSKWNFFEDEVGDEFVLFLKQKGYDSATFEEYNENDNDEEIFSNTIVVFNPSKIIKNNQYTLDLWEKKLKHNKMYLLPNKLYENYDPNKIYLHGGPNQLEGNAFKRYGKNGSDMGALFFIEESPTGYKYALGYAISKFRNGGIWRAKINLPKNKIFDFTNPQHKKIAEENLGKEHYKSWVKSSRNGHLCWTQIDDELFQEWGFEGAVLFERPSGFFNYSEDAISIAVFEPQYIEIVDFIPKKEALEKYGK